MPFLKLIVKVFRVLSILNQISANFLYINYVLMLIFMLYWEHIYIHIFMRDIYIDICVYVYIDAHIITHTYIHMSFMNPRKHQMFGI